MIPLLFHGDDADSHRRRSFYVCTIASPLHEVSSSWDTRVLLAAVDNCHALPETYEAIDQWLVHSFTELQEGRWLTVDPWNNPIDRKSDKIIGNYRAILVGVKGDEKFIQRMLRLKNSWVGSDRICAYCHATASGPLLYTMFGPHAPHRSTRVSNEEFFLQGCTPTPWLRYPGFSFERVFLDWLHLVDLSLTPESAASVSCLIYFNGVGFGDVELLPRTITPLLCLHPRP